MVRAGLGGRRRVELSYKYRTFAHHLTGRGEKVGMTLITGQT